MKEQWDEYCLVNIQPEARDTFIFEEDVLEGPSMRKDTMMDKSKVISISTRASTRDQAIQTPKENVRRYRE